MVIGTGDLRSYLQNKGRSWSDGNYIDPARVARYVQARGPRGLATEFRVDAAHICSLIEKPPHSELIRVASLALDLSSPEVGGVADIVVGGLELACGIRAERDGALNWVPWLIAGGFVTLVVGVVALSTRRR